jgi:hypothetical protein
MHTLNSIKLTCDALWNHDTIYNAHYEIEKPRKTDVWLIRSKIW